MKLKIAGRMEAYFRIAHTATPVTNPVTVVNAKNMETKNVSRLGDVLDRVPCLYLQRGMFAGRGSPAVYGFYQFL